MKSELLAPYQNSHYSIFYELKIFIDLCSTNCGLISEPRYLPKWPRGQCNQIVQYVTAKYYV